MSAQVYGEVPPVAMVCVEYAEQVIARQPRLEHPHEAGLHASRTRRPGSRCRSRPVPIRLNVLVLNNRAVREGLDTGSRDG